MHLTLYANMVIHKWKRYIPMNRFQRHRHHREKIISVYRLNIKLNLFLLKTAILNKIVVFFFAAYFFWEPYIAKYP